MVVLNHRWRKLPPVSTSTVSIRAAGDLVDHPGPAHALIGASPAACGANVEFSRQGAFGAEACAPSIMAVPVAPLRLAGALPDVQLRLGAKQVFYPHRALKNSNSCRVIGLEVTRPVFGNTGTGD